MPSWMLDNIGLTYLRKALQALNHRLMQPSQILRRIRRDCRETCCEVVVGDCSEGRGEGLLVEVQEGGCARARGLRCGQLGWRAG